MTQKLPMLFEGVVEIDDLGERLDIFLTREVEELTRSRVRSHIEKGFVLVDGLKPKPALKLKPGMEVECWSAPRVETGLIAEDIALNIIHEDEAIIVLNKSPGILVHPGAGNASGTIANAVRFHYPDVNVGGEDRPGIVHRLDKDTSGVMVIAKNDQALQHLSNAFRERSVDKVYTAFCFGHPKGDKLNRQTGHIRDPRDRRRYSTKVAIPDDHSPKTNRFAHSIFSVVRANGGLSQVSVQLLTGRTHQIRAHATDMGHPLVRDALYGGDAPLKGIIASDVKRAAQKLTRQALHASTLSFTHPLTKTRVEYVAELPSDLAALEQALIAGAGENA